MKAVKLTTKGGAIITLAVCGGVYAYMTSKGQKPPAGLDQVIIGAAATLFVVQDANEEKAAGFIRGKQ